MPKELKVGLLALISVIMLYFGFNFLKGTSFVRTFNTYYLYYNDVRGLTTSDPVTVSGLAIGKVKRLELLQDGKENKIKVTIQVEDHIEIGDSTTAILKSSDLLGGKMIVLNLGPNSTVYPSGKKLVAKTEKSINEGLEEIAKPALANTDSTLTAIQTFMDGNDSASFKSYLKGLEKTTAEYEELVIQSRQKSDRVAKHTASVLSQFESENMVGTAIQGVDQGFNTFKPDSLNYFVKQLNDSILVWNAKVSKINKEQAAYDTMQGHVRVYQKLDSIPYKMSQINESIEKRATEKPTTVFSFLLKSIFSKDD